MDEEGTSSLRRIRSERIRKAERLRSIGSDPYPSGSDVDARAAAVVQGHPGNEGTTCTLAGRVKTVRRHGNLSFLTLHDPSGTLQLMLQSNNQVAETTSHALSYADAIDLVDLGDIVEATGTVTTTRRGEISLDVQRMRVLVKSLRPPPDKWHGVSDDEMLVRKPYLESMFDVDVRKRYQTVGDILFGIRSFMREKGFTEFLTPVLQPQYGGGKATPFRTHLDALDSDFFLAISHELYLKRLLVGGFESVYTIGRYFRNEGIDRTHNPEFSMLETMTAYQNFEYNMDITEGLYRYLMTEIFDRTTFRVGESQVDFGEPWTRIPMVEAVAEHCGVDFSSVDSVAAANDHLDRLGLARQATIGHALHEAFDELVAPALIQPTIVSGHPVEVSPLARRTAADDRYVERFELYVGGTEQGDNWTELNDPVELLARLEGEDASDRERHPVDLDFIEAVEYGLPPATGLGPGIERLAMLLTETDRISDVTYFPLARPHTSAENREIYSPAPGE